MTTDEKILSKARDWATSPSFDAKTRGEISALLEQKNDKEITERFYRELEFGTGGMRGIIGAGTNRMNVYNIRKATTALATYLKEVFPAEAKAGQLKVALSHDSRHFSRDFTKATAEVLAANGITALITKELRPVPMLSFMVRHYGCKAGVCVTASHNPPNYNGYKVYWETGGQLVPPHDAAIIELYGRVTYDELKMMPFDQAVSKGLAKEIGADLDEAYFSRVKALSMHDVKSLGQKDFKVVYTPLHGSGLYPVTEMLKRFGFSNVLVVPEQREPNGDFPTVKSPNPEDPDAMNMARKLAQETGADLILATDPDCDRIGMEIRVGDRFFRPNGNQIGCLLNDYVLASLTAKKQLPANPLIVKTIVTTDLQDDLAKEYGAHCDETLTGFKWICQLIEDYQSGKLTPRRQFVCGGEESYGFLAGDFVRDKDGVLSCCLAAEMVAAYKAQGKTVVDALDRMFTKHGVYQESLYNLTLPGKDGADAIRGMMTKLRKNPPAVIDGIAVTKLRDFETRQELAQDGGLFKKSADLSLPKSDVLQFILKDGTKVSVRPSGTEPKIKFYVSVREPSAKGKTGAELAAIKATCVERVKRIEDLFVAMAK